MTKTGRTLALVRHAKSSWDEPDRRDFDRPLNDRGQRTAPEMGQRLLTRGQCPDRLYCSSARRAWDTALILARAVGYPEADIEPEPELYLADQNRLIERIRRFPADAGEVWLVGHNPDLSELANQLAGFHRTNLPTCAIFRMQFDCASWASIEPGSARLLEFDTPKQPWDVT